MAITDDLRKTLTDPTPFYAAAGATDLAAQKLKEVPALLEKFRSEAPERIAAVRSTDTKAVQERMTKQAREAQATVQSKVTEVLGTLDTDIKKLRGQAQDFALQGVGKAAEYAVKARETYDGLAERGERAVRTWRGETAEEINDIAVAVEPAPAKPKAPQQATRGQAAKAKPAAAKKAPARKAPAAKKQAQSQSQQSQSQAQSQSTPASRSTSTSQSGPAGNPSASRSASTSQGSSSPSSPSQSQKPSV